MQTMMGFDDSRWLREQRPLGAGSVAAEHVVGRDDGGVLLIADGTSRTGAAIRTTELHSSGRFLASLRCAAPRGAVCAFFLYEPDAGDAADEIDMELLAGTSAIWLTTWIAGRRTNHIRMELSFDPAAAFHEYEIRWSCGRVEFLADGAPLHAFDDGVPTQPMALFASAWWPGWLEATLARGALEIERIDVRAPT